MSYSTNFSTLMIILLLYAESFLIFHIRNIGKLRNLLLNNACSTIIHALKTYQLQRLYNQCARLLTKSPRREHITWDLKNIPLLKIQDRITYKILMRTYTLYYNNNIAPFYICELSSRKENTVNIPNLDCFGKSVIYTAVWSRQKTTIVSLLFINVIQINMYHRGRKTGL